MKDRCHQTRGGFTLIEMLLSMMITAMVVGALGAMFTAAAQGWQITEDRQKISMQGNLTFRQMERLIGSAKLMGLIRTGNSTAVTDPSGALMAILWQHDSNGDQTIQLSELAVIWHDMAAGTLRLVDVRYPDHWTAANRKAMDDSLPVELSDLEDPELAQGLMDFIHRRERTIARGVTAASMAMQASHPAGDGSTRITYVVRTRVGSAEGTSFGSAALRAFDRAAVETAGE